MSNARKKKPAYVWMKVTRDKYELPVALAETAGELAKLTGSTVVSICSGIYHERTKRCRSIYKKVRIR